MVSIAKDRAAVNDLEAAISNTANLNMSKFVLFEHTKVAALTLDLRELDSQSMGGREV